MVRAQANKGSRGVKLRVIAGAACGASAGQDPGEPRPDARAAAPRSRSRGSPPSLGIHSGPEADDRRARRVRHAPYPLVLGRSEPRDRVRPRPDRGSLPEDRRSVGRPPGGRRGPVRGDFAAHPRSEGAPRERPRHSSRHRSRPLEDGLRRRRALRLDALVGHGSDDGRARRRRRRLGRGGGPRSREAAGGRTLPRDPRLRGAFGRGAGTPRRVASPPRPPAPRVHDRRFPRQRHRRRRFAPGAPHRVRVFSGGGPDGVDSPSRDLARSVEEIAGRDAVRLVFRLDRLGRGGDHRPLRRSGSPGRPIHRASRELRPRAPDASHSRTGASTATCRNSCNFDFLGNVARVNAEVLRQLALAPAPPREVRLSGGVTPDAKIAWAADDDSSRAGFEILWRETTDPRWSSWASSPRPARRSSRAFRPTIASSPCARSGRTARGRSRWRRNRSLRRRRSERGGA